MGCRSPRHGYVRLNPNQYYRGAAFFVAARCVPELHDLGRSERYRHLAEMAGVAHAVFVSVSPRKLNYEALGNSVAHLFNGVAPNGRRILSEAALAEMREPESAARSTLAFAGLSQGLGWRADSTGEVIASSPMVVAITTI